MKKLILVLLVFTGIYSTGMSKVKSNGIPFIKNYLKANYNAGTQNWDIVQTDNGLMYCANNEGVLEYDGVDWRLIKMPNNSVVRSLAADTLNRVYVGAYNEFGYLEPDQRGKMTYHSLINLLPKEERDFNEVWQIFPYKKGILFHTFSTIFYFKNGEISQIKAKKEFHLSFMVHQKFYVQEKQFGLFVLEGRYPQLIKGGERFKNVEVVSMLPFSDNSILIATALQGLFIYDGEKVKPWGSIWNATFKQKQIYTGIQMSDGTYVFGTVRDGLFVLTKAGILLQHLNTENGLQNNTILSLYADLKNNLWVGLDNGIDYIELSSPLSVFPKGKELGTGYASIYYDGNLYLGTNMGLFVSTYDFSANSNSLESDFELVQNTSGQVWSLQNIGGELICGHNKGTFRIEGRRGILISDVEGGWKYLYKKEYPNKMIGGTYTGLVLFERNPNTNNKWRFARKIEGFNESCREMIWNKDNSIWMCHGYKGVFHLFLDEKLGECVKVRFYNQNDGFKSQLNINVHQIKGEVVFSSDDGFYKYNPDSDRFQAQTYLNNLFGTKQRVNKLFEEKNGDVWFFQGENTGLLKLQMDNSYEIIRKPFAALKGAFTAAFENVNVIDEKNVLFATESGFVHYDPSIVKRYDLPFQSLIREVDITSKEDSVIYFGTYSNSQKVQFQENGDKRFVMDYRNNALRFYFSAAKYDGSALVNYQFQLVGFDQNPSNWSKSSQKEYTNLSEGEYVFRVQAKNQYGVLSKSDEFYFTILPPWYRSKIAYAFYLLLILISIYITVYFVRRRVKRIQFLMKRKQEEELKLKEQKYREEALMVEKEIVQLRNEKLRTEVDFKNRELASSTMNILHKNEVFSYAVGELRNALRKIKDPTALVQVKKLMKKIDAEFNSDEDWDQFEIHFDQVHEDFLKRIRKNYPQLTPKDLRMCAYLRMNLSTKEIAPLMNISVRGVEISRYRLRKKFDLKREENLIDFLLKV